MTPSKSRRPAKKTEILEVRMPPEDKAEFMEACRREGRTASEVVRDFAKRFTARSRARVLVGHMQGESAMAIIKRLTRKAGPRGAAAAGAAALATATAALMLAAPSAAGPDLRAAYDRFDANKDGSVTVEEFIDAHSGDQMKFVRREAKPGESAPPGAPPPPNGGREWTPKEGMSAFGRERFKAMDADADGVLSFGEFQAEHDRMIEHIFSSNDADGDGKITRAEWADASQRLFIMRFPGPPGGEGRPAPPPPPPSKDAFAARFDEMDADKNGAVDLAEFKKAH